MANYNTWYGPYPLTRKAIDANVLASPLGNYCLSLSPINSNMSIDYVGRAHDRPVHDRLIDHLSDDLSDCKSFWVMYKRTAIDTYIQECQDYHTCNPRLNRYHPAQLSGSKLKCPVKGCNN